MADSKNRGSGALLFCGEIGTLPPRLDSSSAQRDRNGGGCATRFSDFSAFREMLRQERDIAKAERKEAARAVNRRLMEEVFELRLQLMALKEKQSSGVTGGEPPGYWIG